MENGWYWLCKPFLTQCEKGQAPFPAKSKEKEASFCNGSLALMRTTKRNTNSGKVNVTR